MKYHILNGDALRENFENTSLTGQLIILRETLVDGPVMANTMEEFWNIRSVYFKKTYRIAKKRYFEQSKSEINKIKDIPENASVYLWFERDLFCQVNFWFTIYFIKQSFSAKYFYPYLILPDHHEWSGFGNMSGEDLINCYCQKIHLRKQEIHLFSDLWIAYQHHDLDSLQQLSSFSRKTYPYLSEVVKAHLERSHQHRHHNRPYQSIKKIINELNTSSFSEIFREFSIREGVYGFSDLLVKKIYNEVLKDIS